jgi:tetratricopeptide (TPR) repeat protein
VAANAAPAASKAGNPKAQTPSPRTSVAAASAPATASKASASTGSPNAPSGAVTAAPATSRSPAAKAAKTAAPRRSEALEKALADAERLIGHNDLAALDAYRLLGSRYPRDAKVLEGWSRIAASTEWWGESLRVAERWAAIDRSSAAQLHLARTQRRLGQLERAIQTLKQRLERDPKDNEAQSLLELYAGNTLALR